MKPRRIPLVPRVAFTLFIAVWAAVYAWYYGPQNFLWFCNLANFGIVSGLWLGHSLLLSSQAVSVLIVQLLWLLDVVARALFGRHLIGGTEYMFMDEIPLGVRLFSFFHIVSPVFLLYGLSKTGYHRRAWALQSGATIVVLPLTYAICSRDRNINWVHGLFGKIQEDLDPILYLALLGLGYLFALYLPTHLVLKRLLPPAERVSPPV